MVKRRDESDLFYSRGDFRSDAEHRVHSLAKFTFENSFLSITSNEYLFNIFESDIVLRVPIDGPSKSDSRELIINIKIDGIHHRREKKKRFCGLRDKYLESQGVINERIEASALRRMDDKEVKEWMHEKVAEAKKVADP